MDRGLKTLQTYWNIMSNCCCVSAGMFSLFIQWTVTALANVAGIIILHIKHVLKGNVHHSGLSKHTFTLYNCVHTEATNGNKPNPKMSLTSSRVFDSLLFLLSCGNWCLVNSSSISGATPVYSSKGLDSLLLSHCYGLWEIISGLSLFKYFTWLVA